MPSSVQMLEFDNGGKLLGVPDADPVAAFRRVLQEEHEARQQRSVVSEVSKLDQSLRDAVNQQVSSALKEITNRDSSQRVRFPAGPYPCLSSRQPSLWSCSHTRYLEREKYKTDLAVLPQSPIFL
jgi:hypothetical protein